MQKKILVTGGAGFIGSNLCESLIKDGHEVYCVDSFFSGKFANIKHLLNNKRFVLIRHNIIYPIKKKFKKIDEIYNLACPASPVQYQFDPILTLRVSVEGMQNMLNLARKYNAKILQASTSEVYGDPLEHPQKESYFGNVDCLGKRACYDEGKRTAETLCKDYSLINGVDARIVRLFNIYGPKMMFNDGRVVSNFIIQALLNEDITIHGDGMQSRSFMYIDDLITAFKKIMDTPKEKIGYFPINLGNPDERTMISLAENIKRLAASKSNIIFMPYEIIPERFGDPKQRKPDINRAKELLNWQPLVAFEEGFKKTIDDFKKRLENKTKILVFASSFSPEKGNSIDATKAVVDNLNGYDFDLITARKVKRIASFEKVGKINIHRVGFGYGFDKYILPVMGLFKAIKLHKKNHYEIIWAIMAGYGTLAALFFSIISRIGLLVSLNEGSIDNFNKLKKWLILPFHKIIFRKSHRLQVITALSDQQMAWLEDEKALQVVDFNKGDKFISKKTKEQFQEIEIITSRL